MEGGSPFLIWQRWTLPMYYAQLRYWGDHPPIRRFIEADHKWKARKTPPPGKDSGRPQIDWSLLDGDKPLPGLEGIGPMRTMPLKPETAGRANGR
jgi:hypothetical protein